MSANDRETAIQNEIAERVVFFRQAHGLSQAALGGACGCTFQQIQKYEQGRNRISASRLKVMAEFLDVPIAEFYGLPLPAEAAAVLPKGPSAVHALNILQEKAPEHHRAICRLIKAMTATCR